MSNPRSRESKRLAMRSQDKRRPALEAYVESCVEEEVRRELEAAFELLEERPTRQEFVRVAGSAGAGHFNAPQVTLESLLAQLSLAL